jgi:hypothetical protein
MQAPTTCLRLKPKNLLFLMHFWLYLPEGAPLWSTRVWKNSITAAMSIGLSVLIAAVSTE